MLTLAGRVAIVTGAAQGIGHAIAEMYAKNGMKVVLLDIQEDKVKQVTDEFDAAGWEAKGIQCDVANNASISSAVAAAAMCFGGIDVVVNSAGILDAFKIEEMTRESWDRVLAVNLTGTFFITQAAIPYLEKSKAARVINISSNAGRMGGFEGSLSYAASKGGIISITYGMARQLAPRGILVNCIAPGTTITDIVNLYTPEVMERLRKRFPIGRMGRPEEIAAAACYYASEEASFTTGSVLDVNGGLFMG
jgi:3-oxoacyl-[acyl-carrier protein] reductase